MPVQYAREFGLAICQHEVGGERVSKLSNETGVSPATLHRCKDQALIDAELKEGTKSIEVDELAEARSSVLAPHLGDRMLCLATKVGEKQSVW
jgi:hypothetical protein